MTMAQQGSQTYSPEYHCTSTPAAAAAAEAARLNKASFTRRFVNAIPVADS